MREFSYFLSTYLLPENKHIVNDQFEEQREITQVSLSYRQFLS